MQNRGVNLLLWIYARLVHLYPPAFREELAEDMQATFSDLVQEGASRGVLALGMVIRRELRDLPGALLREYWLAFTGRSLHLVYEYKQVWRIIFMMFVLVSMAGPWGFDLISVPREFACSPPFVRLEGDFCGEPNRGLLALPFSVFGAAFSVFRLVTRPYLFPKYQLYFLSLLLPVFVGLLLYARQLHRHPGKLIVFGWSLLLGANLFRVLFTIPRPVPILAPWGIWLFDLTAVIALAFETLLLLADHRDGRAIV